LHHFWSDHLDELKSKSVFWDSLWKDNSCPRSGTLHLIKCQASLRYMQAIRCIDQEYMKQAVMHNAATQNSC